VPSLGEATGWIAAALVVAAASVPLGHRALARKRAALESRTIRSHVVVGIAASAGAFAHALAIMPSLGSSTAIAAGMDALAPGALAFLLLLAHVGVGLQLRNPKLRGRPKTRRTHVAIATAIAVVVAVHVALLARAG
jgi:uncharacterized membrane protein YbjE (DUF340 family)